MGKLTRERMTLIPLKLYLNEKGKVKLLIGIAKGKKIVDKRQTEKREIGKKNQDY